MAGVVVVGVGAAIFLSARREPAPKFRKEKIARGDVVATVTATGTVNAVTSVKIGSQVSGIISALHADFNSEVKTGELLAELDPTPFQAAVDQRRADLDRSRAEQRNAESVYQRAKGLHDAQIMSQGEYDAAVAGRASAQASVRQSEATLRQAEVNLENTKITSPIDGVVVDRQYDIGQTVAASFQAPTLFTIARDLTKMQVSTNIDEADIGGLRVGQAANFTVDAFPDDSFHGVVSQIRLAPQTVQNVVTYPVIIDVDNPEGRLRPGMTANVSVPVDERKDVLRVPNAALRFRPDPSLVEKPKDESGPSGPPADVAVASGAIARGGAGNGGGGGGGRWRGANAGAGEPALAAGRRGRGRAGTVYVDAGNGKLREVRVRTSITDGTYTAVEGDGLAAGDEVIVGLATSKAMAATPGSPMGGGGMRGPRM